MTVNEFINDYDTNELDNLEVKEYVPFAEKLTVANNIIQSTCFDDNKNIKINSPSIYMLYLLSVVHMWTNIDVDFSNDPCTQFDALNKDKIIDGIFYAIPKEEIKEFKSILDMLRSDTIANHTSPQAFISNQIERFGTLIGMTLEPVFTKLLDQLENLDKEQIKKFRDDIDRVVKSVVTNSK